MPQRYLCLVLTGGIRALFTLFINCPVGRVCTLLLRGSLLGLCVWLHASTRMFICLRWCVNVYVCMCDHARTCMFTMCTCLDMCTFTHGLQGRFCMSAQCVFNWWLGLFVLCSFCAVFWWLVCSHGVFRVLHRCAFPPLVHFRLVCEITLCLPRTVLYCSCGVQFYHCALRTEWCGTNTALQHSDAATRLFF